MGQSMDSQLRKSYNTPIRDISSRSSSTPSIRTPSSVRTPTSTRTKHGIKRDRQYLDLNDTPVNTKKTKI